MPARLRIRLTILGIALCPFLIGPSVRVAPAADRVCAPTSMIKVVTSLDVPGLPHSHFIRVPKTLYRFGDGLGRVEESLNPETGLHLLMVVAEPHVWMVDRATGRGKYQRDPGPTYFFRARMFGDPSIQSALINALEFGCETAWLAAAGAARTKHTHPTLGRVDRLEYREGDEAVSLYVRSGRPVRVELHRSGDLQVGIDYLQYQSDLPLNRSLFERPAGIQFSGEARR
jgi:hypothetical protein